MASSREAVLRPEEYLYFCPTLPPGAFRLLDPDERPWRARACIVLWLSGLPAATAWRMALSRDPAWSAYLRDSFASQFSDRELFWCSLRQRDREAGRPLQTRADT